MSLKDLESDLQSKESKSAKREHNKTIYNEWQSKEENVQESSWQKIKDNMQNTRVRAIVIGGIIVSVIVLTLLAAASFMYFQSGFFSQNRVFVTMEAPQSANSNVLSQITFRYENDNRARLDNVEIVVRFGDYFVPEENQDDFERVSDSQGVITIGSIKGGEKGEFILAGHFVGPRDVNANVLGTMRYVAESTSTRYEIITRSSTVITSSPVTIDIESPNEIVSGNLLDIVIKVQNTSTDTLSNIKLTIDMPEKFSLYSTEPRATHSNVWLIDELMPEGEKIFHVRGGLDAPIGSVQRFNAKVGTQESSGVYVAYADAIYTPRIVQSPILVNQIVEKEASEAVYAGEQLKYRVIFTNNSDIPLRNAIVTLNLEGSVLDFETLQLNNIGDYDQTNRRIVWKSADVPALRLLEPGQSGEVNFSIYVKENLPVDSERDHHFSVTSIAAIDSEDIPSQLRENKTVLSNVSVIPVGAKVILSSVSEYVSGSQILTIGEKTVYKITMKISSINNDISDTIVHIPLPTHTTFESGTIEGITYNNRSNDVMWNVGTVEHGTGVIKDVKTISFNVGIVPSVDQVKKNMELVKEQKLTAMDNFVGVQIQVIADAKSTSSEDRTGLEGSVQKEE